MSVSAVSWVNECVLVVITSWGVNRAVKMAEEYSRDMTKLAVARILQAIGWHSATMTPLEILTDVMIQYITQLGKSAHDYANECSSPMCELWSLR